MNRADRTAIQIWPTHLNVRPDAPVNPHASRRQDFLAESLVMPTADRIPTDCLADFEGSTGRSGLGKTCPRALCLLTATSMKRRWNFSLWAGFFLVVVGLVSYVPFFALFPVTRDFPWVNLLLFGAGAVSL